MRRAALGIAGLLAVACTSSNGGGGPAVDCQPVDGFVVDAAGCVYTEARVTLSGACFHASGAAPVDGVYACGVASDGTMYIVAWGENGAFSGEGWRFDDGRLDGGNALGADEEARCARAASFLGGTADAADAGCK